jgi:type I restriction enzyme S subunit
MMKCKLEDIADVTMGQSPKSEFYNSDGEGMPFLQGNRTFGTMYPTFDTYTTKVTKMAKAGDVIMSVRAPVGDLNFTPVDMCLGRGVCGIRMKNGNQKFLFYLLKYYMPLLLKKESGTVFGSVNRNDINGLEVDIPEDESDQKIIARYLAMLDDMIEENEKINKNLEEQIESFLIHALTSSETSINAHLGDYLYIKGRIGWKGLKKSEYLDRSGYRIINGESLTKSGIDWNKAGYISEERYSESPEIMLRVGDILLSKDGTIGKIGYVNKLTAPTSVASGIFVIRNTKPDVISTPFIYYLLKSGLFKAFVAGRTEGSVIPHLYQKDFTEFEFPLPSADKMKEFDDLVTPLFQTVFLNLSENEWLASLRDSLLPRLMSGEIDVSDIDL